MWCNTNCGIFRFDATIPCSLQDSYSDVECVQYFGCVSAKRVMCFGFATGCFTSAEEDLLVCDIVNVLYVELESLCFGF